jgi:hypothetical protein
MASKQGQVLFICIMLSKSPLLERLSSRRKNKKSQAPGQRADAHEGSAVMSTYILMFFFKGFNKQILL